MASSEIVNATIEAIKKTEPNTKIIVMDDFNDKPNDTSTALMEKKVHLTILLKRFGLAIKED